MQDLAKAAVDAALGAGASYADARAVSLRRQYVITKNGNIEDLSDTESEGIGVRVLVDGAWGLPASDGSTRPVPETRRFEPSSSPAQRPAGTRRTSRPSRLTPASTARRSSATPSPSR